MLTQLTVRKKGGGQGLFFWREARSSRLTLTVEKGKVLTEMYGDGGRSL